MSGEFTEEEIAKLKAIEKRRETQKITTTDDEFRSVAQPGDRVRVGETRANSGALEWFKKMAGDRPKGKSLMKFIASGDKAQAFFAIAKCPKCHVDLNPTELRKTWQCPKCEEKYAIE